MKSTSRLALLFFVLFRVSAFPAETIYQSPVPPGGNPAAVAAPRDDWYQAIQQKFTRFGNKHWDIIFDGDSITNRWENTGKSVWDRNYAANSADFGIEGDRVENVLWRLSKGQVDGIDPKVVVLMIGTNNSGRDSADQIAAGIKVLVPEYEKRCPNAHIILMGIFPRGQDANDGGRQKVTAVNSQISSLDDRDRVTYVDIGPKLIESDGTISSSMMPDFLHPAAQGYQIWSDAIQPIIDKYLIAQPASQTSARFIKPWLSVLLLASETTPPVVPVPDTTSVSSAVITFGGLYNKANTVMGAPIAQASMPSSYQPLSMSYPQTKPIDGGNVGRMIIWDNVNVSNHGANPGVSDHSGDSDPADGTLGGGVIFGTSPYSMTFSQPVEIPSLFWTYYAAYPDVAKKGTISVYANAGDSTPVKTVELTYSDPAAYAWHGMTDFAGMQISKIVFSPGTRTNGDGMALNIDDITVKLKDAIPAKP